MLITDRHPDGTASNIMPPSSVAGGGIKTQKHTIAALKASDQSNQWKLSFLLTNKSALQLAADFTSLSTAYSILIILIIPYFK